MAAPLPCAARQENTTVTSSCYNCWINPRRDGGQECEACSKYRRRNGTPRPLYLIERQVEREQMAS